MNAMQSTFGVRLPNSGPLATAEAQLSTAELAEELGFDNVWVHDHIAWASEKLSHFAAGSIEACQGQDPNFFESLSTVAVLAGRTRRVKLGIAGLVIPFREPRVLAKQVATVQHLSGHRLILAPAIGAIPGDFEVMGVPFKRRGRITNEYLAVLEKLWGPDREIDFEGELITFHKGEFFPKPLKVPMWICGHSEPACQRIARFGNGWLPVYLSPEEFAGHYARLKEVVAASGRDPAEITPGLEFFSTVEDTRAAALKISTESLLHKFKTMERGLAVSVVGTPEEAVEQMAAYHKAGVRHFEFKAICHTLDQMHDQMRRIAARVLPAARAAFR